uniref:Complement C1q-like protein 2 n=2 Tax=Salarias fasciatus TaxID=181472 RepID=A0A672ISX5_SALFA
MRAFACAFFVLGLLRHSAKADSTINSLREAAVRWDGELPCTNWDCECAFKHQRGCCCGAPDLVAVEDQIFIRMMDLSKRLTQLGDSALRVTGEKVAFTASMSPSVHCFGPFTRNKPIPYDSISLNHGRGYNPALGVFTAPCSGLYSFSVSIYSKLSRAGDRMYHKVQLMKNGEVIASTWEDNRDDSEDSASQTVLLSLQRGGQVYVELLNSRQLCG